MSLVVALDFADNPRPHGSLAAPADTDGELYKALRVLAAEYRALLSRYSSGQPAAQYECDTCQDSGIVGHSDICPDCRGEGRIAHLGAGVAHTDDDAVDHFAAAMKDKLAQARAKGRHGWREIDPSDLSMMLRSHVEKGDPRDVANFCMFLWSLDKPISAAPDPVAQEPVAEIYRAHYGNRMGNIGVNAVRALVAPDDMPPPGTKLYAHAAPVAAQAQLPGDADGLTAIYDAFGIGSAARTPGILMACIANAVRRSRCLGAIEGVLTVETPPDPDEGDDEPGEECLLNWGADPEGYAEHFTAALAQFQAAQPRAPRGEDAERMDWIIITAPDMMYVSSVVPDAENIRQAIDAAYAAKGK